MQGPIVDIALLMLLVIFFGLQQRQRPQQSYRFWFAGWIFVVLSYVVWEVKLTAPLAVSAQDAVRFDLMLVGVLLFLISFVANEERLRHVSLRCLAVGVPVVVLLDVQQFVALPRPWLAAGVVAWECCGLWAAFCLIPRGRIKTRALIGLICVAFGVLMLLYLRKSAAPDMADWALAEVTLCAAVLYGGGLRRRSFAIYVGMAGFTAWCALYLACIALSSDSRTLHILYDFWIFPKYFVGFAMILKIFEDATEEKVRTSDELRGLILSYPDPMWIYETSTGRLLSANRQAQQHYGYTAEEFLEMRAPQLEHTTPERVDALLPPLTEGRYTMHRCKDGRLIWVHVTDRKVVYQGSEANMLLARDITEKVKLNREMSFRATHDALTGLPNRAILNDRIEQCMTRCDREGRKGVLLMIDVDHFKRINDTFGHLVGDKCLKVVAARLASKIRQVDTIARVGGEEFASIIGGLHTASDAKIITDSLLRVFEEPLQLGDCDVPVTVSIGVAIYPDDGVDPDSLLRRADQALYAAKNAGRNRAVRASDFTRSRELSVEVMEASSRR